MWISKGIKNSFWSLFGTFLIKAINLISIPVFSRLMSKAEYGEANIFFTYVTIFTVLVGLDFHGCIAKGELQFKDDVFGFLSVGIFSTGIFSLILLLVFNINSVLFERLFDMSRLELNILIIYSYSMVIVSFLSVDYIFNFKYRKNVVLGLAVAILNFGCSVFLILAGNIGDKVKARIIGAAIPTIVIAMGIAVLLILRGKKIYQREYLKYYISQGIPLLPHNLSHFILGNADKIMITNMISNAANGVYSLVYNIGLMLGVLIEGLNNVWTPWMFRRLDENDTNMLREAFRLYTLFFSLVSIIIAAFTPEIIRLISPPEYWEGLSFALWIVFSTYLMFIYQLYVNIEFYEMKTYLISIGTILAALINIILNFLFLEKFGYGFAALSTVFSYFVLAVFHMLITTYILKKKVVDNIFVWILVGMTFGVILLLQFFLKCFWMRLLLIIVSFSLAGVIGLRRWKKYGNFLI